MAQELVDQQNFAPIEIFPSIVNSNNNNLDKDSYYIGTWEEAELFMQDNCYVKKGYRINFNSVNRIFRSLFMCHNESTNVWSHLLGALLFSTLIVYIFCYLVPGHVLKGDSLNVISGSLNDTTFTNQTDYEGTVIIYTKNYENMGHVEELVKQLSNYVNSLR